MTREDAAPGLRVIGMLGGVGSGEVPPARALAAALEAIPSARTELLDADAVVAELLEAAPTAARIEAALGPGLLGPDWRIDRKALSQKVFSDLPARRKLEGLLHPEVRRRFHERLSALEAGTPAPLYAILDVPLLAEHGLDRVCDFLVFVDAPEADRARRAGARHGWSRAEWQAREASQATLEEKRSLADAILDNADGLERLQAQVQDLIEQIRLLRPRPLQGALAPLGPGPSSAAKLTRSARTAP